ncbi:SAM-dependent methyltransferase [Xylanibacillus composti]|uniref:SAM-dependent methyltransferase n=1 Tax=Xylanibacillus composti TaxID=1572762 RepID=A0A8J4GYN2_9BACL|nr:class I SAM-dependent methyltransferase [Xylanibacillus composti]MDT9725539.1 SAM-dependent methyltransferase [Xylanibacillus composti]GIQ67633.1 SAM-dependent methyltransferase [Xylanibacillus composti]
MFIAKDWEQYELIDLGGGEKLERWGDVVLRRPDPQIIWPIQPRNRKRWDAADAHYHRSNAGGGHWEFRKQLPERWKIQYGPLHFYIKPTNFKHTGLFPEQAANWSWIMESIQRAGRPIKLLNLFAYTGGATVAAASAGAEVVHVDAAKGMVQWAKENVQLSGLQHRTVRFITDDVFKFVMREQRRGNRYDAIVMDPPSYGRGPGGETWKLEKDLYPFLQTCLSILSDKPLFVLVNAYTTGLSPVVLSNLMKLTLGQRYGGRITTGELGLPVTLSDLVLPAGILGRWEGQ